MTNKITRAPQVVIDELNRYDTSHSPLRLLKYIDNGNFSETRKWILTNKGSGNASKQIAIVNHVFGYEKLQPEREPRWYVELYNADGDLIYVRQNDQTVVRMTSKRPGYDDSIDHETAVKAKALYGGEVKEIK